MTCLTDMLTAQNQGAAHDPTLLGSSADRSGEFVPMTRGTVEDVEWDAVFDGAAVPTAVLDGQGHPRYVNPAFCTLLGHGAPDLLQPSPRDSSCLRNAVLQHAVVGDTIAHGRAVAETWYHKPDGQIVWVRLSGSTVKDSVGQRCWILLQAEDVTTGRSREMLWEQCFAAAPTGMALLDLQGHWTSVNDAFCDLLGYRRDEILGLQFSDLTYPGDEDQGDTALADLRAGRTTTVSVEKRYRHKDGHPITVLIRSSVDQYGHLAGDHLLTAAADQLLRGVPPGATVARLGGDEFVITCLADDTPAAETLRDRIAELLDTTTTAAGHTVELKASVGIAVTRDPTTPPEELLHTADRDMYTRKKNPRNT
ncbi:PAS domain S-box protein [Saccharopolyspora taberi]|uniref:Uncharacterized protein n=1 Tax=Saccharopolyspora taberi TaxID=60895 RepID=A0ABN3VG03_9PSEU